MLTIFFFILSGMLAGYLLRNTLFVKYTGRFLNAIILLLLFFLGISVGASEEIVYHFTLIGRDALILTIGGTLGSLLCARWVYGQFFKKNSSTK